MIRVRRRAETFRRRPLRTCGDDPWQDYRASLAQRFIEANNPEWKMPPEMPATPSRRLLEPLEGKLTDRVWNHILYGDRVWAKVKGEKKKDWKHRGAHKSGYGWTANGDEWPSDYSDEDIIEAIRQVTPQNHKTERGTYPGSVDGFSIKVSTSPDGKITSAYVSRR